MIRASKFYLLGLFALIPCTALGSTTVYSEGFDSSAADVTEVADVDTQVDYIDYSSFFVGATGHSIPEAPRMVAGSAAQRGVLMRANLTSSSGEAVNLIAGASPLSFSGSYIVSYDAYLSVSDPPDEGSTEQLIWGVAGNADALAEGRANRFSGTDGVWGWLATENGYGTEDTAIFEDGTELDDLGDTQPGQADKFNLAFSTNFGANDTPANSWTQVDVIVVGNNVKVRFNGVTFFDEAVADTTGAAALGYEDPFGSLAGAPDFQWGLFDNFVVTQIPEPTSALLLGLASLGLVARRR